MSAMLIDALSARQGGGQTYLLNLLTRLPAGEPATIHLLAPPEVAAKVASDRVRPHPEGWSENAVVRAAWQKLFLKGKARSVGASLVFYPGGVGSVAPAGCKRVTMFRNVPIGSGGVSSMKSFAWRNCFVCGSRTKTFCSL